MDADGYIVNDASVDKIVPPYRAAVEGMVAAYLDHARDLIHSIYVRGTVARGAAIACVSDLDTFAVVTGDPDLIDQAWTADAAAAILRDHPVISDTGFDWWPLDELRDTTRFNEMVLLMATQSACVWGDDLIPSFPRFKPDIITANNDVWHIKPDIEEAITEVQAASDPSEISYWCRRICKNMLRAGFGLAMIEDRAFTRDLLPCYDYFTKHYPDHAADMRRVLQLAIEPSGDREVVLDLLNGFGRRLIDLADVWLDRYNPSRELALPISPFDGS